MKLRYHMSIFGFMWLGRCAGIAYSDVMIRVLPVQAYVVFLLSVYFVVPLSYGIYLHCRIRGAICKVVFCLGFVLLFYWSGACASLGKSYNELYILPLKEDESFQLYIRELRQHYIESYPGEGDLALLESFYVTEDGPHRELMKPFGANRYVTVGVREGAGWRYYYLYSRSVLGVMSFNMFDYGTELFWGDVDERIYWINENTCFSWEWLRHPVNPPDEALVR